MRNRRTGLAPWSVLLAFVTVQVQAGQIEFPRTPQSRAECDQAHENAMQLYHEQQTEGEAALTQRNQVEQQRQTACSGRPEYSECAAPYNRAFNQFNELAIRHFVERDRIGKIIGSAERQCREVARINERRIEQEKTREAAQERQLSIEKSNRDRNQEQENARQVADLQRQTERTRQLSIEQSNRDRAAEAVRRQQQAAAQATTERRERQQATVEAGIGLLLDWATSHDNAADARQRAEAQRQQQEDVRQEQQRAQQQQLQARADAEKRERVNAEESTYQSLLRQVREGRETVSNAKEVVTNPLGTLVSKVSDAGTSGLVNAAVDSNRIGPEKRGTRYDTVAEVADEARQRGLAGNPFANLVSGKAMEGVNRSNRQVLGQVDQLSQSIDSVRPDNAAPSVSSNQLPRVTLATNSVAPSSATEQSYYDTDSQTTLHLRDDQLLYRDPATGRLQVINRSQINRADQSGDRPELGLAGCNSVGVGVVTVECEKKRQGQVNPFVASSKK